MLITVAINCSPLSSEIRRDTSVGLEKETQMALVVRAYPVRSREAVEQFIRELREREAETRHFFRSFDVRRETWHFQETEHGPGVDPNKTPLGPPSEMVF